MAKWLMICIECLTKQCSNNDILILHTLIEALLQQKLQSCVNNRAE